MNRRSTRTQAEPDCSNGGDRFSLVSKKYLSSLPAFIRRSCELSCLDLYLQCEAWSFCAPKLPLSRMYNGWNVAMRSSEGRKWHLRQLFVGCMALTIAAIVCSSIFALMSTLLVFILPDVVALIFAISMSLVGGIIAFRRMWKYLKRELIGI